MGKRANAGGLSAVLPTVGAAAMSLTRFPSCTMGTVTQTTETLLLGSVSRAQTQVPSGDRGVSGTIPQDRAAHRPAAHLCPTEHSLVLKQFITSCFLSPFLIHVLATTEMPSGLWKLSKYLRCLFISNSISFVCLGLALRHCGALLRLHLS